MSVAPDRLAATGTAAQYDDIAASYQRTKHGPIRRFIEAYSLFRLLGPVQDLAVLDLACGEGIYSRQLRRLGARRVVGVDISPAMIALARQQQASAPGDIEYHICDAQDLPDLGVFDVVMAAYLLHYARDIRELRRMCRSIARQLPAGGRLVAINENPDQPEDGYRGYLQYGFSKSVATPRREGSPITYAMVSGRELIRFHAYHFDRATYEEVLAGEGFTDLRWHPLELDPAGVTELGERYWDEYLANPPVVGLTCRRRG